MTDPILKFTKWCPACKAELPITAFGHNRASADNRTAYCRPHHNERTKAYYATPRGKAARAESQRRTRERRKARYEAAVAQLSPEDRARLGR
ncbi:hypothetical protein [Microbacterium sp. NPDC077057]|uniref:hypothetical protein n=1 Tax=unclassified Microbacterium TaxID=2609290 RepID=UPI0034405B3B